MKIITILIIATVIFAQDSSFVSNEICEERGHVMGDWCMETLMSGWTEIIDEENRTIKIYHDPNTRSYTCERCSQGVSENIKPDTTIVWKKL